MSALPVQDPPRAAAVTAADARRQLLEHRRAGRRDAFVDLAYRYLAAVPQDPPIALELLRALVELGLGGPARELLEARPDLQAADGAGAVRQALDGLPAAGLPWEALRRRFTANLDACLGSRPHLHPLRADLATAVEGLELFEASDGALYLGRRPPGRLRTWEPGFGPGGADTVDLPMGADGPAVAVVGTGLSPLAQRVHDVTRPQGTGVATPIFVLDDDLARAAAWLHALELGALLADDRVAVFLGPGALADLERWLADRDDLLLPELWLVPAWAQATGRAAEAVARRVAEQRGQALADLVARLAERGRGRSVTDWAARLRPGATVLGFTSRATTMLQYSMRDIGHAFDALGYRFRLAIEPHDHGRHTALTTSRAVWEADPALIVLINHFRCEQLATLGTGPLLTWIQDPTDVVLSAQTGASIGPLDFVCGYYERRCTEELGYPRQRFFRAPLPVSSRVFHDAPLEPAEAEAHDCDVMYVGHLHDTADAHVARWRELVPPALHGLLERLRCEVVARHERGEHLIQPEARALFERIAAGTSPQVEPPDAERLANYFVFRLYDILYRRQTLQWIAAWARRTGRRFRLYGSGWVRDEDLAPFAAGPLEHGEPLRRAYRGARLTLQTIPGGFKHQRAYEALLSGSLVLGRRVPSDFSALGSSRWFPRLDEVVFRDPKELERLAGTLLDEPDRRRALRRSFAGIVRDRFTYEGVVRGVLEGIRGALPG